MDVEMTDPGPFDPSVLYDQDNHVSSSVWDGQERGVLRCHEHTSKLGEWRLTPRQIELVEKAGFGYLRRLPSISLDNPLISALVERWRKETNTFHLPVGEMTITLRDVALLLGLPIDGEPVLGVTYTSCKSICERFLGRAPEAGYMSGGMVKLSWLKEYFSQCSDDFSLEDIECYTRAYLLYLIGSTIFSTTTGNKVPVMYLPLFENFEKAGTYAWGAAALSFLYRSLGNASLKSQSTISGCLTLLQCWSYFHLNIGRPKFFQEPLRDCFPLVFWWKGKQSAASVKRDIIFYRKALDCLEPCDVDWLPFKHINIALPDNIRDSLILGRSKTMLICFDKAERHLPDRCLRQYDIAQGIPVDVQQWERKTRGIDSGIHLLAKMESELNEWAARWRNIVEEDDDMEEGEYMYWYSRITRRLVGRPVPPLSQTQRTVKFRTKKKRMNTGLRDIAHIADAFSTKGLDPLQAESISMIRAIAHACLGDEVETTVTVSDASQIDLGQRREKQHVRRNTDGKRKRKDELVQYNEAGEEDEVLLYGSTAGVDQIHLTDAIIGVDHSREMVDRSYAKLGKRVRRREKAKIKLGRKCKRKDNLLKCDAAIRDLESLIAKEELQYSHDQSKENESHIVDEDDNLQPQSTNVDIDCLQTYHNDVEIANIESIHTSNEAEIAELSHDAVEEHKVENLYPSGEVEGAEFSHDIMEVEKSVPSCIAGDFEGVQFSGVANEVDTIESSHDIMEVEKSLPSSTAGEVEGVELSHAANEVERIEASHDNMEVDRGVDEVEMPVHSHISAVEGTELSRSVNKDEMNESSHASSAVEGADTSLTGDQVKSPEPLEKPKCSCAAAKTEEPELSCAVCETDKAEPSHTSNELEKAESSKAAGKIEKAEPPHPAGKVEKAEPSNSTGEIEKAEPCYTSDVGGNKPSHSAAEIERDKFNDVTEIEKDASSQNHESGKNKETGSSDSGGEKAKDFDEAERVGSSLRACESLEVGEGYKTSGGSSCEVVKGTETSSSIASIKADDTEQSIHTRKIGDLNQSVVSDVKSLEAENVNVEAVAGPSPKTGDDST